MSKERKKHFPRREKEELKFNQQNSFKKCLQLLLKKSTIFFFKKWANPGLFFVYFRPFHIRIQLTSIQLELYKLKKHR